MLCGIVWLAVYTVPRRKDYLPKSKIVFFLQRNGCETFNSEFCPYIPMSGVVSFLLHETAVTTPSSRGCAGVRCDTAWVVRQYMPARVN